MIASHHMKSIAWPSFSQQMVVTKRKWMWPNSSNSMERLKGLGVHAEDWNVLGGEVPVVQGSGRGSTPHNVITVKHKMKNKVLTL